jgi:hypothetical protein
MSDIGSELEYRQYAGVGAQYQQSLYSQQQQNAFMGLMHGSVWVPGVGVNKREEDTLNNKLLLLEDAP